MAAAVGRRQREHADMMLPLKPRVTLTACVWMAAALCLLLILGGCERLEGGAEPAVTKGDLGTMRSSARVPTGPSRFPLIDLETTERTESATFALG